MQSGQMLGRERNARAGAMTRDARNARARVGRACAEALEGRQLLSAVALPIGDAVGLTYDGARDLVYILTRGGALERYDSHTEQLLDTINMPTGYYYVNGDVTPDGRWYFAEAGVGAARVDLTTGSTAILNWPINTLGISSWVYATANNKLIYGESQTLPVMNVDPATGNLSAASDYLPGHYAMWSLSRDHGAGAWMQTLWSTSVGTVDFASGGPQRSTQISDVSGGRISIAITDGRTYTAAAYTNELVMLDSRASEIWRADANGIFGVGFDATGKTVFSLEPTTGILTGRDAATGQQNYSRQIMPPLTMDLYGLPAAQFEATNDNDLVVAVAGKVYAVPMELRANRISDVVAYASQTVTLNGAADWAPGQTELTYEWDLDYDGVTFNADLAGQSPTTTAPAVTSQTTRTIAMRVRANDGAISNIVTAQMTTKPWDAVVNVGGPYTVVETGSVTLTAGGSSSVPGISITGYEWDLDYDGSTFTADKMGGSVLFAAPAVGATQARTIAVRAVGSTGGKSSPVTTTLTITNWEPALSAGGPYQVREEGQVQLHASLSNALATLPVTYQWDLNYDGSAFDVDATGANATFSAAGLSLGTNRTVAVRLIMGGDEVSAVRTATVMVVSQPPTATFQGSGTVVAGAPGRVAFSNVQDTPADMAAGFTYSYDFDADGTYDLVNSSSPEAEVPGSYLTTPGTRTVRGKVADRSGAFAEYTVNLTVRQRPTANAGGPYTEQEGRPVTLSGSATGLAAAPVPAAVYQWDLDYDGATFTVDTEGQQATFAGEALPAGTTRTVALRVRDGDGATSEIATAVVTVVSAPPTATFGAVGTTVMGRPGRVAFRGAADSATDMAAGFTYSYDFDADGTYDVVNSGLSEVEVPAGYLGTPGVRSVRGRIADRTGASSEYEAQLGVNAPMDWYPLYPGLTVSSQKSDGQQSMQVATEYRADAGGGIVQHEVRTFGSETQTSDDHAIKVGTTWYLTSETYPPEEGGDGQMVTFSAPLPIWDEGVASGKTLRWSGIVVPFVPANDSSLSYTDSTLLSGSLSKVRIGSVMLQNGTRFDNALLVKQRTALTAPAMYGTHHLRVTRTVTTQTWYVRGIGEVKSEQVVKLAVRSGSRSMPGGSAAVWEEMKAIPQWAQYTTLQDGTLFVNGSEAADRITLSVSGSDLLVYRNGVPSRTPLGSVQNVVIAAGTGNDLVDVRGVAVPVAIDGAVGDDTLYGGAGADTLTGGDGQDRIYGYGGSDVLQGGAGNDRMYGGEGNDSLNGDAGKDLLQGQGGDDWIDAHDELRGEAISGGAGTDKAYVDVGEKAGAVEQRIEGPATLTVVATPGLEFTVVGTWTDPAQMGTIVPVPGSVLTIEPMPTTGSVTETNGGSQAGSVCKIISGSLTVTGTGPTLNSVMPDPAVVGTELRGSVMLTNGTTLRLGEGLKLVFADGQWTIVEDAVG